MEASTPPAAAADPSATSSQPPAAEATAVDAVAAGAEVTPAIEDALLAHYLGNEPKPGMTHDGKPKAHPIEVKLNDDGSKVWNCKVKTIRWEEWRDAQDKGTKDGEIDSFVISSWIVARALLEPALGPVVMALRDKLGPDAAPENAAALLRDYFSEVPGSLMSISRTVVEKSNLNEGNNAVREVEAGKT